MSYGLVRMSKMDEEVSFEEHHGEHGNMRFKCLFWATANSQAAIDSGQLLQLVLQLLATSSY